MRATNYRISEYLCEHYNRQVVHHKWPCIFLSFHMPSPCTTPCSAASARRRCDQDVRSCILSLNDQQLTPYFCSSSYYVRIKTTSSDSSRLQLPDPRWKNPPAYSSQTRLHCMYSSICGDERHQLTASKYGRTLFMLSVQLVQAVEVGRADGLVVSAEKLCG